MATLTQSTESKFKNRKKSVNHLMELRDAMLSEENRPHASEKEKHAAIERRYREILRRFDQELNEEVERAITPVEESMAQKFLRNIFSANTSKRR